MRTSFLYRFMTLLIIVGLMWLGPVNWSQPQVAHALTYTVNSLADPGVGTCDVSECTLREAINAANSSVGVADTISFSVSGDINLSAALPTLSDNAGVTISAALSSGVPTIALRGTLTTTGYSGIRIASANNTIHGLAIYGFGYGVTITGTNATSNTIEYSYVGLDRSGNAQGNGGTSVNGDGIIIRDGASDNEISHVTIGGNYRHGVSLKASDDNTIADSYIGVTAGGADVGNGANGVNVKEGSSGNVVRDNEINYNSRYGVYLVDETTQNNQITGNTISNNKSQGVVAQAGIVNDRTHSNAQSSVSATGDNAIASNDIISNTGIGIYNIGASPLITGNNILSNTRYGIYNYVYFGSPAPDMYSPDTADDDLVSVPAIYDNTIYGNGDNGIRSLDTAPLNKDTLESDNVIGDNSGSPDVRQMWFGAVEVITGTSVINTGITVHLNYASGLYTDADNYVSAGGSPEQGIWTNDAFDSYDNVTSWIVLDEFVVNNSGRRINYQPCTVTVSGAYTGTALFSYDAISTTHPVTPAGYGLRYGLGTGVTAVPTHTLHRYQIAEVNFGIDSDGDGMANPVEGGGDSDGDTIPDYLDTDSDNNGIPDGSEGGPSADQDGDGIPDYLDLDDDGDGISDTDEGAAGGTDTDNDTTPDYHDTDSDNDGISDSTEGDGDADGDGTPNYRDTDSDNNGILDEDEGDPLGDADNDGISNYLDVDDDGDGISDADEGAADGTNTDGDGDLDYRDTDSDDDGIPDADEYDNDQDGSNDDDLCSAYGQDSDSDGIPNCQDNDADGDGVPNFQDGDSDDDGQSDRQEGSGDDDGDGVPNYLDVGCAIYLPVVSRNF